jgi:hypothetical protein
MSFSLRWLFVAVAFIALSVVSLLNANHHWTFAWRTSILLGLSVATIGAIASNGRARAQWVGVAIAGWIHLLLGTLDSLGSFDNEFDWLHVLIARNLEPPYAIAQSGEVIFMAPPRDEFVRIARFVVTVVFATLGGFAGAWFYSRRESSKGSGQ